MMSATMDSYGHLPKNTLIITPNLRLCAAIRAQYNADRVKQGLTAWETPRVIPYALWLEQTYKKQQANALKASHLLTDFQSQLIWAMIIQHSTWGDALLQIKQTAKLAYSAWQLAKRWQINRAHPSFADSEAAKAFQAWANTYQAYCDQHQVIDQSQLFAIVQTELSNSAEHFAFYGFAEMTFEQTQLIDMLKAQGKTVSIDPLKPVAEPTISRTQFNNETQELMAMAQFCKNELAKNPNTRIACVLPNLSQLRHKVHSIFSHTLTADQFNISAGLPLSDYPLVLSALQLIKNCKTIPYNLIQHILKTPFIAYAETEKTARHQLDAKLRKHNCHALSKKQWITLLTTHCPLLAMHINQISAYPNTAKPSDWAQRFTDQLSALGWPGERILNSLEYQTVKSFQSVLDQFAALDHIQPDMQQANAIPILSDLCQNTLFQAQSNNTPVQILGLLEAGGLSFDAIWLGGLNDQIWPASPAPNPFLPIQLQKKYDMPHASHARELHFCEQVTDQLTHSAPRVIVSYATQTNTGECGPSPLITQYDILDDTFDSTPSPKPLPIESLTDNQGPPLKPQQKAPGGSNIFKIQANCPFQAFALHRLNAAALAEPYHGLNAADRGVILHNALEHIWQKLQSSKQLHHLTETQLNTEIHIAVAHALKSAPLKETYRALEQTRLCQLLTDWLNFEKTRAPFKIAALEKKQTMQFADLEFDIRADRIDELVDGTHLIIDYKSKKTSPNEWQGDRPREPQLPLYALQDNRASAIAFAQVRSDGVALKPSEKENWQAQLAEWHKTLTHLANDFKHGNAEVNPRDKLSCDWCELQGLCRIQTLGCEDDC